MKRGVSTEYAEYTELHKSSNKFLRCVFAKYAEFIRVYSPCTWNNTCMFTEIGKSILNLRVSANRSRDQIGSLPKQKISCKITQKTYGTVTA
jgi:hypothetical protein